MWGRKHPLMLTFTSLPLSLSLARSHPPGERGKEVVCVPSQWGSWDEHIRAGVRTERSCPNMLPLTLHSYLCARMKVSLKRGRNEGMSDRRVRLCLNITVPLEKERACWEGQRAGGDRGITPSATPSRWDGEPLLLIRNAVDLKCLPACEVLCLPAFPG